MKYILWLALSVFSTTLWGCPALSANGLSAKQQAVMQRAFEFGSEKNMGYSLAAIAWQESSAGKYTINLQDPSAGVFHITINNALSYLKWEDTPFNRNRAAHLLIEDFKMSAEFAMINLTFWQDIHDGNWMLTWASYNAGYNWKAGTGYADDIAKKIRHIRLCEWG